MDRFVRHAWFALAVFSCDGIFLLDAVGILSLSNYSWTIRLQIIYLGRYGMHCENFCPRQLEFWACPYVFDQLDGFVRHAWFALSVFSRDGKLSLEAVFEVVQLFLYNWIADCLVWWWKILTRGSWNFELVQLFLDSWIADCFVRHACLALSVSFRGRIIARGSWNFELIELFLDN